MTAIVPLTPGANLPAYLQRRDVLSAINKEVLSNAAGFPVLSIKGKVFTLVKDGERKVLTRPEDPDEVLQSITLTVVRANTKSRVFYAKSYVEGEDGAAAKPDCSSNDGIAPNADSRNPQAKKCQLCPHAVWGSKVSADGQGGKGTACTVNTRLAVIDPDQAAKSDEPEAYLLRVPAGSRGNFGDVVKAAEARGIPYNALALKVGFDKEAPSPKLTFKLVGLVDDHTYGKLSAMYETDDIKAIVGLGAGKAADEHPDTAAQDANEADLDAALAAKAAKDAIGKAATPAPKPTPKPAAKAIDLDELDEALAAPAPTPAPAPAPKPKAKPKAEAAPAPAPAAASSSMDDLLGGLDELLGGGTDD
jgi:hypothetical protein